MPRKIEIEIQDDSEVSDQDYVDLLNILWLMTFKAVGGDGDKFTLDPGLTDDQLRDAEQRWKSYSHWKWI